MQSRVSHPFCVVSIEIFSRIGAFIIRIATNAQIHRSHAAEGEFKQEGLLAARLQKIEFTNNCHHNVYEQEFDRDHARSLSETQASTDKPMSDGSWSYISKETSSSNRHAL